MTGKRITGLLLCVIAAIVIAGCSGGASDNDSGTKEGSSAMFKVETTAFKDGEKIPAKYANTVVAGGQNVSVPVSWTGDPEGTESFAVVCVDISAGDWLHWAVKDIPANKSEIPEGASTTAQMPMNSVELMNSFGNNKYEGPQPPPGSGPHTYEFIVYALNVSELDVPASPTFADWEAAVKSSTLASAKISGIYER